MIVEEDLEDEAVMAGYSQLYLTDMFVSGKAVAALGRWVAAGGVVLATGGAALYDELNATHTAAATLFGAEVTALHNDSGVRMIKEVRTITAGFARRLTVYVAPLQDLPFATPVATASFADGVALPAFGLAAQLKLLPGGGATKIASWGSGVGGVAGSHRAVGKGHAIALGLLPGLAYFAPAVPARVLDKCPRDGPDGCFTCATATPPCRVSDER